MARGNSKGAKAPRKKKTQAEKDAAKAAKTTQAAAAKAAAQKPADQAPRPSEGAPKELSYDERRALLVAEIVEIERLDGVAGEARKAAKTAGSQQRLVRKRIIGIGFTSDQIDYALRLRSGEDKAEIQRHQGEREIAQMLDHVVWRQADLFDTASDRTPSVDRAKEEGRIAGFEGKVCTPPQHYGHEQQQQWIEGWHDGQSQLVLAKMKVKGEGPLPETAGAKAESFEDALPAADTAAAGGALAPEADGGDTPPTAVGDGTPRLADGAPITSGTPVPRGEWQQRLRENNASAETQIRETSGAQQATA